MSGSVFISVVVPVYNAEAFLKDTMDALVAQTCEAFEIIAVDDGSTDSSPDILDGYAERYPQLIKVLHQKNCGLSVARRSGIAAAKGNYIGFCDSDDIPHPTLFQTLTDRAIRTDADMVVCSFQRIDAASGKVLSTEMGSLGNSLLSLRDNPGFFPIMNTAVWNKIFKSDLLKLSEASFDPPRIMEDVATVAAFVLYCETVAFVNTPLYDYFIRPGSHIHTLTAADIQAPADILAQLRSQAEARGHQELQAVVDLTAFIHFGVSSLSRFVSGPKEQLDEYQSYLKQLLDGTFPQYRHNEFCTIRYNLHNGNQNLKPMLALWCYRANLLIPLLRAYNIMTKKLGVDIKW